MPLLETKGAGSAQGFGLTVGGKAAPVYVEDVFSTYLYTGNGTTQTITNGIDLSTKGGLVWTKRRDTAGYGNYFIDTSRGATKAIESNATAAETTYSDSLTGFTTTGYTLGADTLNGGFNNGAGTYVGWTFRKQPKFFDVVTYTGDGTTDRAIAHNLGSAPGAIIVKAINSTAGWVVYHRSLGYTQRLRLDQTTAAETTNATIGFAWGTSANPDASVFRVGDISGNPSTNQSAVNYVAYLFAHDAGGFGLTGTDNVISCGSTDGVSTVNLGYEPQWVLIKKTNGTNDWTIIDTMRRWTAAPGGQNWLYPNLANTEGLNFQNYGGITSTGFSLNFTSGETYIYIAIRRGPMRTPTSGTSVFSAAIATGNGSTVTVSSGFPVDLSIDQSRSGGSAYPIDRMRGPRAYLLTNSPVDEAIYASNLIKFDNNTGIANANWGSQSSVAFANWMFRRAPNFFDIVCYSGNGSSATISHNLGVTPELAIIIARNDGAGGAHEVPYSIAGVTGRVRLNENSADQGAMVVSFAASSFSYSAGFGGFNVSGVNYVAYLFASCPGVSKVGTFTQTSGPMTINCGFTGGARFVLIKIVNTAGSWYLWDTARGITASTDPILQPNTTNTEDATRDWLAPNSTGFATTQSFADNWSSGVFIYLAIA